MNWIGLNGPMYNSGFLKLSELTAGSRRRSEKEFYKVGPATEKARSRPKVLYCYVFCPTGSVSLTIPW